MSYSTMPYEKLSFEDQKRTTCTASMCEDKIKVQGRQLNASIILIKAFPVFTLVLSLPTTLSSVFVLLTKT